MVNYDSRVIAAFNSLGTKPLEILDENGGKAQLGDIKNQLEKDNEVETVLEPFLRKYFEVLDEKDMVEYDTDGILYLSEHRSVKKNGVTDEEIQRFVGSFNEEY